MVKRCAAQPKYEGKPRAGKYTQTDEVQVPNGGATANASVVRRGGGGVKKGEDRRQPVFHIPATYRPAPGVLDFGFRVIGIDLKKV